MKIWKYAVLFYGGGWAYLTMELLFRGRSDPSMFLAGGLCFLLVGHLQRLEPRLPLPLRAVVGAAIVTAVELAFGMAVNRNYTVWDYRSLPLNFMGQICLRFSLLWVGLSAVAMAVFSRLERQLSRQEKVPGLLPGDLGIRFWA